MGDPVTMFMAGGAALLAFAVPLIKAWQFVVNKIEAASKPGNDALKDLADYKLHVAQTYAQKGDISAALEPVLDSLAGVKQGVDLLTQRLDRVIDGRASAPRRRASTE